MCAASASTSGVIVSPASPVPSGASRLAKIARKAARRCDRIAGARADDLRAAIRVEHRGVQAPVLADAIRFRNDDDRGAGRRAQRIDARIGTGMRDGRERRLVGHDRVSRHARERLRGERHHAEPHPAVVGRHAVHARRRDEDQARHVRPQRRASACRPARGDFFEDMPRNDNPTAAATSTSAANAPITNSRRDRGGSTGRDAVADSASARDCNVGVRCVVVAHRRGRRRAHFGSRRFRRRRDPLISEPRDGADEILRVAVVAERAARLQHGLRERRVAAIRAAPYRGQQLVAADRARAVLDEIDHDLEHADPDRDIGAAMQQSARVRDQLEFVRNGRTGMGVLRISPPRMPEAGRRASRTTQRNVPRKRRERAPARRRTNIPRRPPVSSGTASLAYGYDRLARNDRASPCIRRRPRHSALPWCFSSPAARPRRRSPPTRPSRCRRRKPASTKP